MILLQDLSPSGPVQPRRLLPVVGAEELRGQGAVQDHHAGGVQRAAVLPAAHAGVPGVRAPAAHGVRADGPRREDGVYRWYVASASSTAAKCSSNGFFIS